MEGDKTIRSDTYYSKNREKLKEKHREYYRNNREKVLKLNNDYRKKNIVYINKKKREYYKNNRENELKRVRQYWIDKRSMIELKSKIKKDRGDYLREHYEKNKDTKDKRPLSKVERKKINWKRENDKMMKKSQEFRDKLNQIV
jgi:hypothetical protein